MQKFKISAKSGGKVIFLEKSPVHSGVEKFDEIPLSRTVKEIEANLWFSIFVENSKWPPFLGRGKYFENWQEYDCFNTLWVENFDEIVLSCTVKEIEANLCFAFFAKARKFKMAAIFGERNFF